MEAQPTKRAEAESKQFGDQSGNESARTCRATRLQCDLIRGLRVRHRPQPRNVPAASRFRPRTFLANRRAPTVNGEVAGTVSARSTPGSSTGRTHRDRVDRARRHAHRVPLSPRPHADAADPSAGSGSRRIGDACDDELRGPPRSRAHVPRLQASLTGGNAGSDPVGPVMRHRDMPPAPRRPRTVRRGRWRCARRAAQAGAIGPTGEPTGWTQRAMAGQAAIARAWIDAGFGGRGRGWRSASAATGGDASVRQPRTQLDDVRLPGGVIVGLFP